MGHLALGWFGLFGEGVLNLWLFYFFVGVGCVACGVISLIDNQRNDVGRFLSGQVAVLDASWLVRINTETFFPVRLILRVVSIEPDHLAVAFKGEDMGDNTVEKPAVVADDHRAACEFLEGLFQSP